MHPSSSTASLARRFIEDIGNMTQSLGVGRMVGQIYALLYFSREARTLADMQNELGISKGGASMGVRQLEQWGAVKKIWVKGDRRDFYQANDWFGQIIKNAVIDTVGKKLAACTNLLDSADAELSALDATHTDIDFIRHRVEHMRKFQSRTQSLLSSPLIQAMMR
jgi:DNA-binding transcriptional regulator GbsR (MarR family)